ncbi:cyanoexosortase B [Alkalinema sp. FACHB-956]|uniref:cyanoexosortase B n=1 Tax=Alkalinema sp. FACHB-956 TaxID=2692768 RepID=UPI0016840C14|nr:cyanoexosortase B [Alkalinema sp. FACHB-956]MBD2326484.1 cyanoexosortase B [Alkalinema sp. FACHB-956]
MGTASLSKSNAPAWVNGVLLGTMSLLYTPLLLHWYQGWLNKSISIEHEYFSHGLIGIPFAVYIAWTLRHKWSKLPDASAWEQAIGLGCAGATGSLYLTGLPDFVNLSLPLMLASIILCLKGWAGLRLQGFPLVLIALATPNELPYLITPYTLPLQSFIASCAGLLLQLFGMNVTVDSINLFVNGKQVEVAPYCAGLKMLFTSLYVALMLLYWTGTIARRWAVVSLLASAVALSITANIIRNTMLTFFHGTGQDGLFEWLHDSWGGDLYSAGLLGLLVLISQKLADILDQQSNSKRSGTVTLNNGTVNNDH